MKLFNDKYLLLTKGFHCLFLVLTFWFSVNTRISGAQAVAYPLQDLTLKHVKIEQGQQGWSLISPDGIPFFSLGVCVLDPGFSRANYDPENPGYASWKYYESLDRWSDAALMRLRTWNFTTIGGWSDFKSLRRSKNQTLWLTPVLHVGSTAGAPWWDMWDPAIIARMDAVARDQIIALRDDPRLLGYYSDNEMGWWNATLWKMTLEQSHSSGQKQRLIQLLRDVYQDNWNKLLNDFDAEKASSWETLQQGGMLYVKPGSQGFKVMRRFLGLMAARYYELVHHIIRKYDSHSLILGDRYQSFFYPEVAQAASPWVDAISSNLNAHWNNGNYLRCYLETLHRLTGKPIMISEFYSAAYENRSGNRNNKGVFPVTQTQTERAAAAKRTLTQLARTSYVLGADWFQYFDEPRHGRDDGENFNFGLVDIFDQPYKEITSVFASFNGTTLRKQGTIVRPNAMSGVPPAPRDPFANFLPTLALKNWDLEHGFVPSTSSFPLADLYICWDAKNIYLGLYALDITEDAFYRDRSVPKIDRALWTIQLPGRPSLRIRLGAGRDPISSDASIRLEHLSGVNLTVRSATAVALPAENFGLKKFRTGDSIALNTTFLTHGQCYQMDWKHTLNLAR